MSTFIQEATTVTFKVLFFQSQCFQDTDASFDIITECNITINIISCMKTVFIDLLMIVLPKLES